MLLVLDGDTQPDVGERGGDRIIGLFVVDLCDALTEQVGEVATTQQRPHPSVSLREHLECVLRCQRHGGEHAGDVLVRHGLMEQVGQGVDEHPARFAPPQGLVEPFGVQPDAG